RPRWRHKCEDRWGEPRPVDRRQAARGTKGEAHLNRPGPDQWASPDSEVSCHCRRERVARIGPEPAQCGDIPPREVPGCRAPWTNPTQATVAHEEIERGRTSSVRDSSQT